MKFAYLILSMIFLTFALFQTNDPDTPIVWIILYGYTAILSFLMFTNSLKTVFWPVLGLAVYLTQAIISWPRTFEGMESTMTIMRPEIETARETSGMIICALMMVVFIILIKRKRVTSAIL